MVHFLDKSEIAKLAPSVFASSPSDRMSDRYSFVSSSQMIRGFEDLGWGVTRALQPHSRVQAKAENKKHRLGFQKRDLSLRILDPRNPSQEVFPEILITNSSDGSCSLSMAAGLFALVCSNGLVVQSLDLGSFSQRHMRLGMDKVEEAIVNLSTLVPKLSGNIEAMHGKHLNQNEQFTLASAGKLARWGLDSTLDPKQLLSVRRQEDVGNDLWTVFNRVQENTIRGGFKGDGQKRQARELTNIDATQRVNLALWNAAESMLSVA